MSMSTAVPVGPETPILSTRIPSQLYVETAVPRIRLQLFAVMIHSCAFAKLILLDHVNGFLCQIHADH